MNKREVKQLTMTDALVIEVLRLAEQLSPTEKQKIIDHLKESMAEKELSIEAAFQRELGLLTFNVGEFPPDMSLRRADEYGDDER